MNSQERSVTLDRAQPVKPDPATVTEDSVLALLRKPDLDGETIQEIVKSAGVLKSRKVRLALAAHPRTARRLSLRLIRDFYTADLARFTLQPAVAADLKHAAAELLIARLPAVTLGERISLARRSPLAVAAALLRDREPRVWKAALENPRLTEAAIVKVLQRPGDLDLLVPFLCRHAKWSTHPEIRAALLLNEKIPREDALVLVRSLPAAQVRNILHVSRMPKEIRTCLESALLT